MSFGWMGVFRQGAWRAFRSFVLKERQDVGRRLSVIQAELSRIGSITVHYRRSMGPDGVPLVTEERVGFSVTPGSSLEKLVQAYVACGGNPLDISHFFMPDRTVVMSQDEEGFVETADIYPYGGVAFPKTAEPDDPGGSFGVYDGGFLPLKKYPPFRLGGRKDVSASAEVFVNMISSVRSAVSKEIRYKLNDREERIKKLCDLREQLIVERDVILTQAFGGLLPGLPDFDPDRYALALRLPTIVRQIDEIFYTMNDDGSLNLTNVNTQELAKYDNLFEDILPEELNTSL